MSSVAHIRLTFEHDLSQADLILAVVWKVFYICIGLFNWLQLWSLNDLLVALWSI